MPLSRQELATAVLNGKVYVIGGYYLGFESTTSVQVYTPATDTWALADPLPYAVNHNSAAVAGGKLYSFGAGGGVFVYNPNSDSWAAVASSHYVHSQTAAVGVINNQIYLAGGMDTPSQRELEVYDPVANSWTIKAPMSVPRNHTAGGVIAGKFYVVGGRLSPNAAPTAALEAYDPQTNTWSTRTPMPTARAGIAVAVVNNELWVFGGEEQDALHAEVEVYNPVSNSWRWLPDMPLPRHGSWASVIGNDIYIPGGGALAGLAPTNTNQIFTVDVPFAGAAFFTGEIPLGNGVYYLQFSNGTPFGYYSYLTDPRWIYHFDMGFEYLFDANDGHSGIYFYDFASSSFFYTSPSTFPYLYDFSLNAWLYYLPDVNNPGRYTHNPRWFFNFATGQWITL